MFNKKNIILGVSGGIAAYKAAEFTRMLMQEGADVRVIMTKNAQKFIGSQTFYALTGNRVIDDFWSEKGDPYPHINLSQWADVCIGLPVTASMVSRLAMGLYDTVLDSIFLATDAPVFLCPAMNSRMYESAAVQRNIAQLNQDGFNIISPDSGCLACGEIGLGRLPALADILSHIKNRLVENTPLVGKRVLITAGPTREYIDDVRFISNRATGEFAHLLSNALIALGSEVTVITGPSFYDFPGAIVHSVETTREMFNALESTYSNQDIVINTAAVSDITFSRYSGKLKKSDGIMKKITDSMVINQDLLEWQIHHKTHQFLVGFALEDSISLGFDKLTRKPVDILFINDVSELGTHVISPTIVSRDGAVLFHGQSIRKSDAANELISILKSQCK